MAFLDEQGLQHLVDKINIRSSKTLPDNAPDGTIIIDPNEYSEGFNISMDVDTALSETSINPVQNKVIKTALDNKHDKDTNILVGTTDYRSLGFSDKYCLRFDANTIGQTPVGMKVIINGNDAGRLVGENAFANNNLAFTGTDGKYDGEAGLVPAPTINNKNCFLKSDGTWTKVPQTTVTVDAELSDTSTNPIQNKAVNAGINTVKSNMTKGFQTITASIPTKVSDLENDVGYLNMGTLPVFASTDSVNHWTARQTFDEAILKEAVLAKARIAKEVYASEYINGTTITPTYSTLRLAATGATTLDMSTIVADCLSAKKTSTVFTAYITATADYTLTITNAGTIKYIGSASDVAITSAGLLLNIMMLKDTNGNVTSIVQASKLEGGA